MPSSLPHWIGLFGEGLNFAGAAVMACDIFFRGKERIRALKLRKLHEFGVRSGLETTTYEGVAVSSPDLPLLVLQRAANRLAYLGVGLFMGGFLCLTGYHLLGILAAG